MSLNNTYIIGDVHGCFNTLMALIKKIPKDARLIFVGDLCDRGKYSKQTMEFVINNNYECIKGNHEYLYYNYIRDTVFRNISSKWTLNDAHGGLNTVLSYENDYSLVQKHINWIETLPHYIQIDNYFITHGFGLPYYKRKDNKDFAHTIMINRIDKDKYKYEWEDYSSYDVINIFGHCDFKEVVKSKNYFGIDTGCIFNNKLSAIQLGTMNIISEPLHNEDIRTSYEKELAIFK